MEIGGWFSLTYGKTIAASRMPPAEAGGLFRSCLVFGTNRLYLKYPPTAVGGINAQQLGLLCRLHLNNPPIPIGGIKNGISLFQQPARYCQPQVKRRKPKTIARLCSCALSGFCLGT